MEDRLPHRVLAPEELVGLLADPGRRRVFALLTLAPARIEDVASRAGIPARDALTHLDRLQHSGVVVADDDGYTVADDVFERSVREAASTRVGPLNDEDTRLFRRYFFRNRLLQIPSEPWALERVLTLIAEDFQPGERYTEREVNSTLYGWHGDWAALRRLLVDRGYLNRSAGVYWRVDAAQ